MKKQYNRRSILIPLSTSKELERIANQQNRSLNNLICTIIQSYLKDIDKDCKH